MLTLQLSAQDFKWSVNKKARPYLEKGIDYVINNENEQAYPELMQAIRLDPTCSIALFYLSTLTRGDAHKDYVARTKSSLRGKPEEEKAFFALVDSPSRQQANSMLFEKMHTLYPANFLFSYYYSITRPGDEKSFVATQELIRQFPNEAAPYNNLAYMYMNYKKDMGLAREAFEKYISLHPDGCNPYDSMGEYYLNNGDYVNAKKYYGLALEKYPFYTNSIQKLDEIAKTEKTKAAALKM